MEFFERILGNAGSLLTLVLSTWKLFQELARRLNMSRSYIMFWSLVFILGLSGTIYFGGEILHHYGVYSDKKQSISEPCFNLRQGEGKIDKEGFAKLFFHFTSNANSTIEKVATRMLILENTLDENKKPLGKRTKEYEVTMGPGRPLDFATDSFDIKSTSFPLFVVFEIKCVDIESKKPGSQIEFLKTKAEPKPNNKILRFVLADTHETNRIEEYMQRRGISKLTN